MAKQSELMKKVNKYMQDLETSATQEDAYKNFGLASNTIRNMYLKQLDTIAVRKNKWLILIHLSKHLI